MTGIEPLALKRRIRGGWATAERIIREHIIRMADGRDTSLRARIVRGAAGFSTPPIPLYWYREVPNFGDMLSAVVVRWMSNGTPVHVSARYQGKLLAAGSILHRLARGDQVWGSGAIRDAPIVPSPGVTFHAVRGPLTRSVLRADVPEVYGDPAMLLPLIYTPRTEKRFEVGLVPHYVDRDAVRMNDPCVSTIDVLADWQSVIDRIAECETILSSSLHGLIVAEAYGIPALWTTITDGVAGEGFKFRDYYLSTSREPPEPLVWNGALAKMSRCLAEPPRVDTVPLLGAWPRELTF